MGEGIRHWSPRILVISGTLALLVVGSVVAVSVTEENDGFCATCHVNPERTYGDRSRAVAGAYDLAQKRGLTGEVQRKSGGEAARDLASSHRVFELNCVACHRGANRLGDRATALALGGHNTLFYLTGRFDPDHSGVDRPGLVEVSCLRSVPH